MSVETVLISVSDKTGLPKFGRALAERGIQIYSTGNTYNVLSDQVIVHEAGGRDKLPQMVDAGVKVSKRRSRVRLEPTYEKLLRRIKNISEYTGYDEKLNGRLKTLDARVFEGILTPDRGKNQRELFKNGGNGAPVLDMVVVNFYPFEEVVRQSDVNEKMAVELIDIGGPAMVRSAAKNFEHVIVVVDPHDYDEVIQRIRGRGNTLDWRRMMALKALQYVAAYDVAIAAFFAGRWGRIKSSPTA